MSNRDLFHFLSAARAGGGVCLGVLALLAPLAPAQKKSAPSAIPPSPREASLGGLTARLETDNPLHVVRPGAEDQARFVVTNEGAAPAPARLEMQLESFDGARIERDVRLDVPAHAATAWTLPKDALGAPGHKTVRFRLRADDAASTTAERMLAYLTPTGRPRGERGPGTLFGLAFGAGPDNTKEESALAADWLGLDVVRLHPSWGQVQPKPDLWAWEKSDDMIQRFESHGIKIQILFSGTPFWAVKDRASAEAARKRGEKTESRAPNPEAWERFVGQYAARYRGRVAYYEIWNEPDIGFWTGTDDEYLDMLRRAYRAIKAADPQALVMTGGFAGGGQEMSRNVRIVERTLTEARDAFDIIAYHRHGFFKNFTLELDANLLAVRERAGAADKPLYFTETAMDSRRGLRHQAETLVKKIAYTSSLGAVAHTWFNLHDMSNDTRQMGFSYGLMTRDGEPKPAFAAYNSLTAQLRGKTPAPRLKTDANVWALPFRAGSEWVIVCWREEGDAPAALRLATDASQAQIVDLMGNGGGTFLSAAPGAVGVPPGAMGVELSSTPVYVRLSGARAVAAVKE